MKPFDKLIKSITISIFYEKFMGMAQEVWRCKKKQPLTSVHLLGHILVQKDSIELIPVAFKS